MDYVLEIISSFITRIDLDLVVPCVAYALTQHVNEMECVHIGISILELFSQCMCKYYITVIIMMINYDGQG